MPILEAINKELIESRIRERELRKGKHKIKTDYKSGNISELNTLIQEKDKRRYSFMRPPTKIEVTCFGSTHEEGRTSTVYYHYTYPASYDNETLLENAVSQHLDSLETISRDLSRLHINKDYQ